jgi:putative chitinase
MLTETIMQEMWPNGDRTVSGLLEAIAASAPVVFAKYGLSSDLLIAHAMAQFTKSVAPASR